MKIVHLLNWDLKSIEKILPYIKNQGFNAIQINPMQPFKEEKEFFWWSSYQPLDFKIGNRFGNKEDLKSLCNKANALGIDIIVDVVANHTANKSGDNELTPHPDVAKELLNNPTFWKDKIRLKDGENRYEAVNYLIGLPGLDLKNLKLMKIILDYLKELKDCGVKGFRFDAAKHIGLPRDGVIFFKKVKEYVEKECLFAYGEFLSGNLDWQEEFAKYIRVLTPYQSKLEDLRDEVTFIESHDSYLNDWSDSTRIIKSNELINLHGLLNDNYINTLYYVRPIYKPFDPKGKTIIKSNLETIDHFETYFLEDKRFKEINNDAKELKLIMLK